MLKRKAYDELVSWKKLRRSEGIKKCLLVKGARQVGKSFIIREFGKNEYASFIRIFPVLRTYRRIYLRSIVTISPSTRRGERSSLSACATTPCPSSLQRSSKSSSIRPLNAGRRGANSEAACRLKDSEIVSACYNVREAYLPLRANANEDQFKFYVNDTGLLSSMYGHETKLALLNDTIRGNARCGLYENFIAECLVKRGYSLYYYRPDSQHEVEFLVEKNGGIVPIEVKAGNNPTPSLNSYIDKYKPEMVYKLIGGRNGKVGVKETLPHYMVMFI